MTSLNLCMLDCMNYALNTRLLSNFVTVLASGDAITREPKGTGRDAFP